MGAPFKTPVDRAALRVRMERAIDRLIATLDALDAASEDLEDEFEDGDHSDDEPSLAAPEQHHGQIVWCIRGADDCEEGDDLEPEEGR